MVDIDSLSFTEQLVLLGLVQAEQQGETPVESLSLKQRTLDVLETCDADAVGTLSEREVMRALSSLGAKPYLKEHISDKSVTGKGRPQYALNCSPDEVLNEMSNTDLLGEVIEQYW